jgi:lipopolysaccharide export system protein LptC
MATRVSGGNPHGQVGVKAGVTAGITIGALFPLLVMAALFALTTWLLSAVREAKPPPVQPLKHEPDYVIEKFRSVRLREDGTLKLVMEGDRYTHYPDDDLSRIDRLVMTRYPDPKKDEKGAVQERPAPTRVRADEAYLVNGGNEARLYGNVVAHRPAFGEKKSFTSASQYAQYVADFSLLRTPDVVKVYHGESVVRGKGMEYDDITKEWRVLSAVQAVFEKKDKDRPKIDVLPPGFAPGINLDFGTVSLDPLPPAPEMLAPRLKANPPRVASPPNAPVAK